MYVNVLLLQNTCSLTYFQIKIFVHVDEAENISHAFFKHSVFWIRLSMVFLILALYYACNMFEIVESTLGHKQLFGASTFYVLPILRHLPKRYNTFGIFLVIILK